MGIGYFEFEPEDEVWLLEGARTPFIIRRIPQRDEYRLIGEAYVHGFMHGEGITPERMAEFGPVVIA